MHKTIQNMDVVYSKLIGQEASKLELVVKDIVEGRIDEGLKKLKHFINNKKTVKIHLDARIESMNKLANELRG